MLMKGFAIALGPHRITCNAVALLVSDEADYINGVGLIVDGGHQAVCA